MSKRFVIIGALIVLLCVGLVAFNYVRKAAMSAYFAHAGRPPVTVETVNAETTTWKPGIEAVGTTRALNGADLSVQAAGVVRAIGFAAGDKATLGQLLVQIDDSAEQADMAAAQADINLNQRQLDRLTTLRQKGYAAQSTWDDARARLDVAKSSYAHAQATAELKAIKAPFDGIIGIPQVDVGQFAPVGMVVVTLQNLDQMKVDFTVPEQDAAQLQPGQTVRFGVDQGELPYAGRLTGVDPKVDPKTHLVAAQALLDNPEHKVLPGQFLRVRVELGAEPGVLIVPQTALITSLYGDYIYVVAKQGEGDKAELIARQTFVTAGRRDFQSVEIKSGLKPGDQVISAGQNKLQNGARVIIESPPQVSNAGGAG